MRSALLATQLCFALSLLLTSAAFAEESPAERERAAAQADRKRWTQLAPSETTAHPDAARFPGAVAAEAPRISRRVEVPLATIGWRAKSPWWHPTGLYAAPGETIRVVLAPEFLGLGLQLRIGAHTDRTDLAKFPFPRTPCNLTINVPLEHELTEAANPFGGPIFIEVPVGNDPGMANIEIANAVAAPIFILGQTSESAWEESRAAPAPWAELSSPHIALTVPADRIRTLEDPAELMQQWEQIAEWIHDLGGGTWFAERLIYDPGISAGYMHSGYPIVCSGGLDQMLSAERLRKGDLWGFAHEIGHNQQYGGWTPAGQGEVTCNWFPVYVLDQSGAVGDVRSADTRSFPMVLARGTIGSANPGGDGHFVALRFWRQIKAEFGWDPFRAVLRQLRAPEYVAPTSNEAKWDDLLIRFSRATNRDLTPHFLAWGAEHTSAGSEAVAALGLAPWIAPDAPGQTGAADSAGNGS